MKQFSLGMFVCAVIVFLWSRSCNKDLQEANRAAKDTIMVKDTALIVKLKKDSAVASDSIKYLRSVINQVQDKADIREINFNNKLAQSDFTNRKLKTALEARDTAGIFVECTALQKQYDSTRATGFAFKYERDSLLQLWPRVHSVDSLALVNCYDHTGKEHALLTNLSTLYDRTDYQLTKALKKKFAVSIAGGYGITGKGLQPFAGVAISYPIFKF